MSTAGPGALHNATFANVPELTARQGPPPIVLHPSDAHARGLREGAEARVYNDRGGFTARGIISDRVRQGVAASTKSFCASLPSALPHDVPERQSEAGLFVGGLAQVRLGLGLLLVEQCPGA